jgi:hypothetical protein
MNRTTLAMAGLVALSAVSAACDTNESTGTAAANIPTAATVDGDADGGAAQDAAAEDAPSGVAVSTAVF